MMQTPKLPYYGMGFTEFCGMPIWLGDELYELLVADRDATIDAMKGKKPLEALGNIPRQRPGATHYE